MKRLTTMMWVLGMMAFMPSMAQKQIKKEVDVRTENGDHHLTIITTDEEGNTTLEEYEGEDALKKIKEMDDALPQEGKVIRRIEKDLEEFEGDDDHSMQWKEKTGEGTEEYIFIKHGTNQADSREEQAEYKIKITKKKITIEEDQSLKNDLKNINFEAFPNPNDGKFNIRLNLDGKTPTSFRIADLSGKEYYKGEIKVDKKGLYTQPVQMKGFDKGVYIIQILQGGRAATKRVVVQ